MVHETGSFGKSTRRTKARTATPAKREDPTLAAADKVFSSWLASQAQTAPSTNTPPTPQRRTGLLPSSASAPALGSQQEETSGQSDQTRFQKQQQPTEVILRGYRSVDQPYAAINHYEQIAGRICEDYPREPPIESRRYRSELRDPAFTRRRALTPEERVKVNRAHSGEHWVKVTFESADAADAAIYASPQQILGHLVYAEPYHGVPPTRDEPIPDPSIAATTTGKQPQWRRPLRHSRTDSWLAQQQNGFDDFSPPHSQISSLTADTTTVGSTGVDSSSTVTGRVAPFSSFADNTTQEQQQEEASKQPPNDEFCRAIPTVRKAKLLPVEQALLPAPSLAQRIANHIPFLRWFNGAMIGSEVPRTDSGEFDWARASLYWKLMWWLDFLLGLFGGEIRDVEKED
jgi:hypothetical protein